MSGARLRFHAPKKVTPRDLARWTKRRASFETAHGLYARGWITGMGTLTEAGGRVLVDFSQYQRARAMTPAQREALSALRSGNARCDGEAIHRRTLAKLVRLGLVSADGGLTRKGMLRVDLLRKGERECW